MSSSLGRTLNTRALFVNKQTDELSAAVGGDTLKEMFGVAYDDLLVLARARLRRHGGGKDDLDTKTLVHEACPAADGCVPTAASTSFATPA